MTAITQMDVKKVRLFFRIFAGVFCSITALIPFMTLASYWNSGESAKTIISIFLPSSVVIVYPTYFTYKIAKTGYPPKLFLALSSEKD